MPACIVRTVIDKGEFDLKSIKTAYLLVVHKNPDLVNEFIAQLLQNGDCDIYIHIDKKNESISKDIVRNEHVFVCSEYEVRWGSFEIVKAAIELMRAANAADKGYTHFYFGSGQDLLVKKGLYGHLADNPEKIFMQIYREVTKRDRASARYRIRWPRKYMIRNDRHFYRFVRIWMQMLCKIGIVCHPNRIELNNPVKFYTGSTWFIAPIEVMRYILDYIDDNPDYCMFWEDSLASDLMFFQTIVMNSPYACNVTDGLMYVRWGETFATRNHPQDVTIEDDKYIEAGNYFCARKFDCNREAIDYYLRKTSSGGCEEDCGDR